MACNIMVVVREVWDTRDLTGGVLDNAGAFRSGAMQTRFEPEDLNAVEAALRVKDANGGSVVAVTVGEPRSVDVLRECLYRGVDRAIRIAADPAGLDDQAMAKLLAGAIRGAGAFDLVLVGTAVPDEENSMLGRHLAAELGVPAVSWVDAIEEIGDGRAVAKRAVELGYESVAVPFPALLAMGVALLEDDPRAPRPAKAMLKLKMKKAEIPAVSPADAGAADPAAEVSMRTARREPIPPRAIESREVDPESEAALKGMLDAVLKGD